MKNSIFTKLVIFCLIVSLISSLCVVTISANDDAYIDASPANDEQGWSELTPQPAKEMKESKVPMVTFESKSIINGTTESVDIVFSEIDNLKSILIEDFVYDSDLLELVGGEWRLDGAAIADWDSKNNSATLAFENNTDCNGVALTLTFKAKSNVEGASQISANLISINSGVTNGQKACDDEAVPFSVSGGMIFVAEYRRGDVNDDGAVNSDDAIYLLRYTLDSSRYQIIQNGDMNGNEKVDSDDAIHLLRHTLAPLKYKLYVEYADEGGDDEPEDVSVALAILKNVWASYNEDDKFVAAGGFGDNMNWEGAGSIPTDNEEALATAQAYFVMGEDAIAMVEEIANLMHGMNTNIFTAGAFKLKADADKDAFIASVTESVKGNRWIFGSPEKFVVITLGDYIITAFGHAGASEFSANTIPTFVNNVKACYENAEVIVEESLITK